MSEGCFMIPTYKLAIADPSAVLDWWCSYSRCTQTTMANTGGLAESLHHLHPEQKRWYTLTLSWSTSTACSGCGLPGLHRYEIVFSHGTCNSCPENFFWTCVTTVTKSGDLSSPKVHKNNSLCQYVLAMSASASLHVSPLMEKPTSTNNLLCLPIRELDTFCKLYEGHYGWRCRCDSTDLHSFFNQGHAQRSSPGKPSSARLSGEWLASLKCYVLTDDHGFLYTNRQNV